MTNNPDHRWRSFGTGYRQCVAFYRAIQKYGWENFEHKILHDKLTQEEAGNLEKQLIIHYRTQEKEFGYNIADGGYGGATVRGKNHRLSRTVYQYNLDGNFIKEWESTAQAASELGLTQTSIADASRMDTLKQTGGFMWRYEFFERINPYQQSPYPNVPVVCLDSSLNVVYRFENFVEIPTDKFIRHDVHRCCEGEFLTHRNYYWCYEQDFLNGYVEQIKQRRQKYHGTTKVPINLYTHDYQLVKSFSSLSQIHKEFAIDNKTVHKYANGYLNYGLDKTGYIWRYADENIFPNM